MTNESPRPDDESIGRSEVFLDFQHRLSRAARVDRSVLLIGERGTGKELAAARVHYLSKRWNEPLVTLNCAALTPSLIGAELFGHESGAFTGAARRRAGRFEAADGGSIFLDEIGNIPMEAQEKILRVVEYGTFERVGSSQPTRVDVRIIGATNVDLASSARAGTFKADLLDRLSFEVLHLPPLRDRLGDIPLLAAHFATRMAVEMGLEEVPSFSRSATRDLESYPWPGNIRELKNVVERAVYRSEGASIEEVEFNPLQIPGQRKRNSPLQPGSQAPDHNGLNHPPCSLGAAVRDLEVSLVTEALTMAQHNQKRAAELLDLSYNQFRGLYRKYRNLLPNG